MNAIETPLPMHTAVKIIALSSMASFTNATVIHLSDYSLTPDGTNSHWFRLSAQVPRSQA